MTVPTYAGSIPSRSNSQAVFDTNVDALLTYIGGSTASDFVPALNTDVAAVNANKIAAAASEVAAGLSEAAAAASAIVALNVSGAALYNAGTTYDAPDICIGSDGITYRCTGTSVLADDPVGSVTGDWIGILFPVITSGDAGKIPQVNSGETALEYVTPAAAIRYEERDVISTFSGALTLDADDADVFYVEVASLGEPTITPANIPTGGRIRVVVSAADTAVITWAAMAWPGGSPPTNSASSHPDVYYIENHPSGFGSNSDNYQAYRVAANIY